MIVAMGHYVALFFVTQLNYYLAPLGIHLFILGMLVSFSAMELGYKQGFLSLVPVAFYLDAKSPLPFGFSLFLLLSLFTIAHAARSRIRREVSASGLITSVMLNLFAFSAYTFGAARFFGTEALHFGPLIMNLFLNAIVVAVFNRIFVETQTGALAWFGVNLAEEQRELR